MIFLAFSNAKFYLFFKITSFNLWTISETILFVLKRRPICENIEHILPRAARSKSRGQGDSLRSRNFLQKVDEKLGIIKI